MSSLKTQRPARWTAGSLEPRWMLAGDAGAAVSDVSASESVVCDTSAVAFAATQRVIAPRTVVFIDADLEGVATLAEGLDSSAELVLLDPSVELIHQISNHLQTSGRVGSVHVITHGSAGKLHLGHQATDFATLNHHAAEIQQWQASLTRDADILLYGCETAHGVAGLAFVDLLASLSGADVAASVDASGSNLNDADWDLEIETGTIQSALAINSVSQKRYRHTLNLTVTAGGQMGGESFEVFIKEESIGGRTVSTQLQSFVFETSEPFDVSDVSVRFTNDLYRPEEGIDRNLRVDHIEIDGIKFESESPSTYSTGTWLAADGPNPGFGRGEVLHANGSFHYSGSDGDSVLPLSGRSFQLAAGSFAASVEAPGELFLGTDGITAVWSYLDLTAGEAYDLNVQAEIVAESFTTGVQGYIGVDYFDSDANEIGESITAIDTSSELQNYNLTGIAPLGTAYATIWISHVNTVPDVRTQLRVTDVQFEMTPVSTDTTPPAVTLPTQEVVVQPNNPFPSTPSFTVAFSDEPPANDPNGRSVIIFDDALSVTGPDGRVTSPPVFTGGVGPLPGQAFLVLGVPESSSGFLPGEYIINLNPNTVVDLAGNSAPAQEIGRFILVIDEGPANPDDTSPPIVELLTETVTSDRPEFLIRSSDSQSRIRFQPSGGDILVMGPDGNSFPATGVAGGPGQEPNTLFEVFSFGQMDIAAGRYQVTAEAGYVIDESGNENEETGLGFFDFIV